MKQERKPLYRKSMIPNLCLSKIRDDLYEIAENGDYYGYERHWTDQNGDKHFEKNESGYYQEYAELFNELATAASDLKGAITERIYGADDYEMDFDDFMTALIGDCYTVYGYDPAEMDYFKMQDEDSEYFCVQNAIDRTKKLTKEKMLTWFRRVITTLVTYLDIKAAHDALYAIVTELDYKGALLSGKNAAINRLYEDLTGENEREFDELVKSLPQRMWLE